MRPGDRLLGSIVVAAARCDWGFTNETWRVDLTGGRRVAVQRFADPAGGARRAALIRSLSPRFREAGVPPVPEVVSASADRIVRGWVDGRVGSDLLADEAVPIELAAAARAVADRLHTVDTAGLELPHLWASVDRLAEVSTARLAAADALSLDARRALAEAIASLPDRFAGRKPGFAHGDLNPTNVLVDATGRIVALLDVEFARLAHPAFDACWWDWVIRFHHPAAWPAMREAFDSAGVPGGVRARDILTFQKLRVLELVADATPTSRGMWLQRLEQTARWR